MNDFDGFLRRHSGHDKLAPATEAQHEVRLNEAERDVQIGGDKTLINIDRRPAPRGSNGAMTGKIARVMTDHVVCCRDFRPENDVEFFPGRRAVQAGGDEDGDAIFGNARGVQALEQRR